MNNKKFWWSVIAVWFAMFASDWILHGMWMKPWYEQTAQFWRPQEQMASMMYWMWIGQFCFAWAFTWIYTKGISKDNPWGQAFRYGLAILLVSKVPAQLGMWATATYPGDLIWRWLAISAFQAWLCSFVVTWMYKPTWAPARA